MKNKYKGSCHCCHKPVEAFQGILESKSGYRGGRRTNTWLVWCQECFDKSDNSSYEDRQCGNRAYEDRCARACGLDNL